MVAEYSEHFPSPDEELADVIGIESRVGKFEIMQLAPVHFRYNLSLLKRSTEPLTVETATFVNTLVDDSAEMVSFVANHPDFRLPAPEVDNDLSHTLTNLYGGLVKVANTRHDYEDKDIPSLNDFLRSPKSISKGLKLLEGHSLHLYSGEVTDTEKAVTALTLGSNLLNVLNKFLFFNPTIKNHRYLTLTMQELVQNEVAAVKSMERRRHWLV